MRPSTAFALALVALFACCVGCASVPRGEYPSVVEEQAVPMPVPRQRMPPCGHMADYCREQMVTDI